MRPFQIFQKLFGAKFVLLGFCPSGIACFFVFSKFFNFLNFLYLRALRGKDICQIEMLKVRRW